MSILAMSHNRYMKAVNCPYDLRYVFYYFKLGRFFFISSKVIFSIMIGINWSLIALQQLPEKLYFDVKEIRNKFYWFVSGLEIVDSESQLK